MYARARVPAEVEQGQGQGTVTLSLAMYSAVPPPGHVDESTTSSNVPTTTEEKSKPLHVQDHQWKKFCELKSRRECEISANTTKRIIATRNKALRSVSQQLSESDREIMEERGVSLPRGCKRKGKRERKWQGEKKERREDTVGNGGGSELEWNDVRKLMDPNPQLKGVPLGKYAPKCLLEEELDECIERGDFQEAVNKSEKLAQREFASKVSTAFDCRDYIKRKQMEDERKRRRKPAKLKWRFEPKQPWEMKGNM